MQASRGSSLMGSSLLMEGEEQEMPSSKACLWRFNFSCLNWTLRLTRPANLLPAQQHIDGVFLRAAGACDPFIRSPALVLAIANL